MAFKALPLYNVIRSKSFGQPSSLAVWKDYQDYQKQKEMNFLLFLNMFYDDTATTPNKEFRILGVKNRTKKNESNLHFVPYSSDLLFLLISSGDCNSLMAM